MLNLLFSEHWVLTRGFQVSLNGGIFRYLSCEMRSVRRVGSLLGDCRKFLEERFNLNTEWSPFSSMPQPMAIALIDISSQIVAANVEAFLRSNFCRNTIQHGRRCCGYIFIREALHRVKSMNKHGAVIYKWKGEAIYVALLRIFS